MVGLAVILVYFHDNFTMLLTLRLESSWDFITLQGSKKITVVSPPEGNI